MPFQALGEIFDTVTVCPFDRPCAADVVTVAVPLAQVALPTVATWG